MTRMFTVDNLGLSVELSPEQVAPPDLPAAPRTGLGLPEGLVEPRSPPANLLVAHFVQRFVRLRLPTARLLCGGGGGVCGGGGRAGGRRGRRVRGLSHHGPCRSGGLRLV